MGARAAAMRILPALGGRDPAEVVSGYGDALSA
jgi:hypothetical protein